MQPQPTDYSVSNISVNETIFRSLSNSTHKLQKTDPPKRNIRFHTGVYDRSTQIDFPLCESYNDASKEIPSSINCRERMVQHYSQDGQNTVIWKRVVQETLPKEIRDLFSCLTQNDQLCTATLERIVLYNSTYMYTLIIDDSSSASPQAEILSSRRHTEMAEHSDVKSTFSLMDEAQVLFDNTRVSTLPKLVTLDQSECTSVLKSDNPEEAISLLKSQAHSRRKHHFQRRKLVQEVKYQGVKLLYTLRDIPFGHQPR